MLLTASATGIALACNGETSDIDITVTGGTTPYTYQWDNGAGTNEDPIGVGVGTYNVTVTDANGCIATATADITEPPLLTAVPTVVTALACNGDTNGSIDLTVNGGTMPYNYQWDNGAGTSQDPTGLGAGTYNVTVTDANGCIATATADVTEPPLLTASAIDGALACNGDTNGSIDLTVTGGTMPYTYQWDNGAGIIEDPIDLGAGIYTVLVSDANGCIATATAEITEPALLLAVATGEALACNGDTNGDIDLTVNGGTAPYTYQWDNGAGTSEDPTGIGIGTYNVTVTDANGCIATATADITEPTLLTAAATGEALLCNGDTDGNIDITVTGGTIPYTFAWTNGAGATEDPANLGAGTYDVVVTDANGCTTTATADITEPPVLSASTMGETLLCNGDMDGNITLTVGGGVTPYTFQWDNGVGGIQNPTGIGAGTYNVTVTDANGCVITASADIIEPTILAATAAQDNPVSCPGALDGEATVTVTGGTMPYTYEWDNGETTPTAAMLGAGSHDVTITDANACMITASVNIDDAAPLGITLDNDTPANCTSCDGTANITINGGVMPYVYTWSNGNSTEDPTDLCSGLNGVTITDANGCTATLDVNIGSISTLAAIATVDADVSCFGTCDGQASVAASAGGPPYSYIWSDGQTTDIATGLCAGNYSVTVTDVNSCVVVETVTITEPTELLLSAVEDNPVSCTNGSDGQATVTATDGTPGYTYLWDNGEMTATATTLGGGAHTVTVTDANGCAMVANVTINEPTQLVVSATGEALLCNGDTDGDIDLTANGGTAPYTYQWDNGAGTNEDPTGIGAGTYTVTVTDANSCITTTSADITEPTILAASAVQDNPVSCPGALDGEATITVTGGTMPYTYEWDNGETTPTAAMLGAGSHDVTITDANACMITASVNIDDAAPLGITLDNDTPANCTSCDGTANITINGGVMPYVYTWSNGNSTEDPTDLCSGLNGVTITDANGCTATLDVNIGSISTLAAIATVDADVSCFGTCDGQASVAASAGGPPYSYIWSDGQTTDIATGLCAGNYSVTVTDVNSCVVVETVTITEPTELLLSAVEDNPVSCTNGSDGQATVTATDGTPGYTYLWDNGEMTATATTLGGGAHTVTVTDANGCAMVANVTINEPTQLVVSATGEALLCNGDTDGDIDLTANGGTAPYTYQWDNGAGTNEDPTGVGAGTYTVTVTDANSCIITTSADITEPAALTASAVQDSPISCPGDTDGQATVTASGGTIAYTYEWDNGETTMMATMLGAGPHTVTITDANACTTVASVNIGDAAPLGITLDGDMPANCTACDGSATITINGGAMPYTYTWSNGNSTEDPTDLCSGLNGVTVTDANGCTATLDVNIGSISTLAASTVVNNDVTCFADCDGEATVTASSGTMPYAYTWSDGQTTPTATSLCAGNYSVTVTDANNCVVVESIDIIEPTELTATAQVDASGSCAGGSNGAATVTPIGGTPNYTYLWDNGEMTAGATALSGGPHDVTVTDANGCTVIASVTIAEPAPLVASATGETLLCNGETGTLTTSVTGGTTPYTYQWDNGAGTDPNPINISAGTYNVTITDANNCTTTASAEIIEPTALLASAVEDAPVSCTGVQDGQATVTASGATPPYTYAWDNGETTPIATMLGAGPHDVTVTDANNCIIIANVNITDPAPIIVTLDGDTPANCTTCNGGATITVTGGNAPYTYAWTSSETIEDPLMLCSGINTVTVTDANGCSATLDVTIGNISTLVAGASVDNQVTCFGACDGQATATGTSGNPPYSFTWSNGQGTDVAVGLCAGSYTVTVTDVDNCVDIATITIIEPVELIGTAVEDMPVSCPGGTDGQASVSETGGTAPYTYEWDANTGSQITPVATNLSGGTYTVTVTDANNCISITTVLVNEPTNPVTITLDNTTPSNCLSCDGSASITLSGGTPPYTILWSNNDTAEDPTGLCAGINTVTVTDANGCESIEVVNIGNVSSLDAGIPIVISNVTCFGICDGSASISPTGGTPPYDIIWSNNQTTEIATGLCVGTHFVTVTDQDGCLSAASVDITEPTMLMSSAAGEALACNGDANGDITLTVNGGTAPYTFQWDNGAGTVQNPSGLVAGTYTVTITDANDCTATASADITESGLLTASTLAQDVSCNGGNDGNITLTVNGGTLPYTFQWDNGAGTNQNPSGLTAGTYSVLITDANGCTANVSTTIAEPTLLTALATGEALACNGDTDGNIDLTVNGGTPPYTYQWDNGPIVEDPSNLPAGTYNVVVVDANNCTATASATITEPTLLTASATGEALACNGDTDGNITLSVNGGTPPYSYNWSNGDVIQNPANLPAGTYSVVVTDANGCTVNASAQITEPTILTASAIGQDVSCFGGSDGQGTVTASGGTAPYTYQWDNGEATNPAVFLNTGIHDVTITDANGCQTQSSVNIGTPAQLLPGAVSSTPATCFGGNDGTATVSATGGTPPYTFEWNTTPAQTGAVATGLSAGVVQVLITDANGCSLPPINVTITQPDTPVSGTLSGIEPTCNGGTDGAVSVEAIGGIPSYTYEWSNGATGQTAFDIPAGNYTVTVTDANGCTYVENITLGEPAPVIAGIVVAGVTCFGDENGSIFVETATGGTGGPYVYSLDGENYQASDFFGGLAGGSYTVYVQDVNGCGDSFNVIVDEPFELNVDLGADITVELGDSTQLFAQTNTLDSVSYTWTPTTGLSCTDCPNPWATGLETTTYQVQISNANGCIATDNITIVVDKNRNVYIPNVFSPTNDGTNDIFMIYGGQGVVQIDVFRVYDRWGELLWEAKDFPTDDPNYGWDGTFKGKVMNPAVFVYYAEVTFIDGVKLQYKGDVTLIR